MKKIVDFLIIIVFITIILHSFGLIIFERKVKVLVWILFILSNIYLYFFRKKN